MRGAGKGGGEGGGAVKWHDGSKKGGAAYQGNQINL